MYTIGMESCKGLTSPQTETDSYVTVRMIVIIPLMFAPVNMAISDYEFPLLSRQNGVVLHSLWPRESDEPCRFLCGFGGSLSAHQGREPICQSSFLLCPTGFLSLPRKPGQSLL